MKNNEDTLNTGLLEKIIENDKGAFEKLFFTFCQPLILFANRFVKDIPIAENLVQDVFLKIWIRRNELNPELKVKSYLYTAVKNQALQHIRHLNVKEKTKKDIQDRIENFRSPEQEFLNKELEGSVHAAISELPDKCRMIFSMNRFDHLSYKEIAEALNISIKTVETQMGRALKFLRKRLVHFLSIFPI